MRRIAALVIATTLALGSPGAAGAQLVSDWNEAVRRIVAEEARLGREPPGLVELRAQVALAAFEAANAADRRFHSLLDLPASAAPASPEAAAAAAAHAVLAARIPARSASLDATLAFHLAQLPADALAEKGVRIGRAAAERVLERPLFEPDAAAPDYLPHAAPGVYVPTELPVLPLAAYVARPWFLRRPDEMLPDPPPALTSERYRRDWDEVRRLGGRRSPERTPGQSAAAVFWDGADPIFAVRLATARRGASVVADARTYALLALAAHDAGTATTVAKFEHAFWRPITAIRNADHDGHPGTSAEPGWQPLLRTPLHAEYPCGHCVQAAAMARILEAEFGAAPPGGIVFFDPAHPGWGATVSTTADYVRQVSESRIHAGVHFRFAAEAAESLGRRVAERVLERGLRPLAD